ncbi:Hypothetical predicted protein [Pelobates cultripes]|uniref:Uncharacterized protein n=1 Tax=Pelobates cultripes TaxID=61616 RepID=A0AAD1WEI2_PELCU|nr:Hypothetical predicted protein [Pelobates cultripes]
MAATPDPQSSSSEEETLDAPDPIPEATDPISSLAMGDLRAPATKGDILNILQNLRTLFHSAMAILQEEVTAVTGRVRVAEEDLTAMAERQQATEEKLTHLQSSHQALQARLDGLDDARHRSNIKIRSIADSIDDNELPQLTRRLLATILNPKQTPQVAKSPNRGLPRLPSPLTVYPGQNGGDGGAQRPEPIPLRGHAAHLPAGPLQSYSYLETVRAASHHDPQSGWSQVPMGPINAISYKGSNNLSTNVDRKRRNFPL